MGPVTMSTSTEPTKTPGRAGLCRRRQVTGPMEGLVYERKRRQRRRERSEQSRWPTSRFVECNEAPSFHEVLAAVVGHPESSTCVSDLTNRYREPTLCGSP